MQRILISIAAFGMALATAGLARANPDLVIGNVMNNDTAANGHAATVAVTVKNQGGGQSLTSCRLRVEVWRHNVRLAIRYAWVRPLAAGAETVVVVSTGPHVHPRWLRLKVDDMNTVAEANEANNFRLAQIP